MTCAETTELDSSEITSVDSRKSKSCMITICSVHELVGGGESKRVERTKWAWDNTSWDESESVLFVAFECMCNSDLPLMTQVSVMTVITDHLSIRVQELYSFTFWCHILPHHTEHQKIVLSLLMTRRLFLLPLHVSMPSYAHPNSCLSLRKGEEHFHTHPTRLLLYSLSSSPPPPPSSSSLCLSPLPLLICSPLTRVSSPLQQRLLSRRDTWSNFTLISRLHPRSHRWLVHPSQHSPPPAKNHLLTRILSPHAAGARSKESNCSLYELPMAANISAPNCASVNVVVRLSRNLKSAIGANIYDTLLIMWNTLMAKINYSSALTNV